jgi:hypothetical protein
LKDVELLKLESLALSEDVQDDINNCPESPIKEFVYWLNQEKIVSCLSLEKSWIHGVTLAVVMS